MRCFLLRCSAIAFAFLLAGCAGNRIADRSQHTGAKMSTYTTKATPVAADKVLVSDSEDGNSTKNVALSTLPVSTATQTALSSKQDTMSNALVLAKITESAGSPLWDGASWPGGGNITAGNSVGDIPEWDGDSYEPATLTTITFGTGLTFSAGELSVTAGTYQAYDADLDDLADGSLSASKVGNGYYVADDCTTISNPATGAICDEY